MLSEIFSSVTVQFSAKRTKKRKLCAFWNRVIKMLRHIILHRCLLMLVSCQYLMSVINRIKGADCSAYAWKAM